MGEHASSNQPSPTDSALDLPPLEELLREEWNSRGKYREAPKKPDGRRGSDEDSRGGGGGGGGGGSSSKRRSIDHSSLNQSSTNTNRDQRRTSTDNEANGGKGDGGNSSIPPLNNIAFSIFVPITDGRALLSPPDVVPETPSYFLEKLERLNRHEAAVRGNIEALYGLEFLRVRAEAAAYVDDSFDYFGATAAVQGAQEADLRADLDKMLANMRDVKTPAGNIKDVPLPNMFVPITHHPINSPREAAANEVLRLLGAAASELDAFDNHVQSISDGIKREMQEAAARAMGEKQDRMDTD
ncbi:hypothetical protein J3F83DRAFT_643113 [Trichoderma novae-zelandiae]